jgi:transcriptional regulator with PAS, ATPase and Fis domain
MDVEAIKRRFGIIGQSAGLKRAINIAHQVAATDLTVLITGESGTGKEVFPQIIHQFSSRKHGNYIPVNCGAIPEGTIDSELFGHEKGSFTGAHDSRKGYFEVADGGTIFLDEVAELPLSTQVRLLRVLESGEFMRVGSSKTIKTDVRVVAATNLSIPEAIEKGKFREDLYYRLNTVPIIIPPLRDRKEDIVLLFRKFAADFSEKYRMPLIQLTEEARQLLTKYSWRGNIRQLKNITEQIAIIEEDRTITVEILQKYLPDNQATMLPVLYKGNDAAQLTEREILYKVLFEMRSDINELRQLVTKLLAENENISISNESLQQIYKKDSDFIKEKLENVKYIKDKKEEQSQEKDEYADSDVNYIDSQVFEESLSLEEKEKEIIIKALQKHNGKRKDAAKDLGISERTLYRKIKEYDINI